MFYFVDFLFNEFEDGRRDLTFGNDKLQNTKNDIEQIVTMKVGKNGACVVEEEGSRMLSIRKELKNTWIYAGTKSKYKQIDKSVKIAWLLSK